jgi:protein-S-isoprenylcysteine O-methyltransferase Ste14
MSKPGVPPPLLFFLSIVSMEGIALLRPLPRLLASPFNLLGIPLILAGVWLHLRAARLFRGHGTTLATLEAPRTLVVSGPFRFTRNPMYLAGCVILFGVGLFLGTGPPLLIPLLFGYLVQSWYIKPEEELLRREFGEEYEGYAARVRAWL